jgi:hypothetical protein
MNERQAGASATSLRVVFRRGFLAALALSVPYFALHHWRVFEDPAWNIPGFFALAAAMPWSTWWFSYQRDLAHVLGWELRNALTVAVVPLAFALNCASVLTVVTGIWCRLRATPSNNKVANAS